MNTIVCFISLFVLAASASAQEYRVWSDRLGTQFEAKLLEVTQEKVYLQDRAGNRGSYLITEFSDGDIQYISKSTGRSVKNLQNSAARPKQSKEDGAAKKKGQDDAGDWLALLGRRGLLYIILMVFLVWKAADIARRGGTV